MTVDTTPGSKRQHPLLQKLREWPTQPGVYVMRDAGSRILYVGKAKNLRNRVRSYFQNLDALTPKTRLLIRKIAEIEFTVTNTELEALLLECNLIKKHRPRYNIRLKDDKNYPYVVLDFTHPFPQFRITRKVIPSPKLKYFGPYSGGVNEIGRFLLKTFQIRDCSDAKFKNRTRPCLNYEIGTCTAPCVDLVSEENYAKQVREATLFLRGKKQVLLQTLKKEMRTASEKMEYEQAKTIRDKIRSVEKMTERQDAVHAEANKDIDILGCYVGDHEVQWVVLFVRAGLLTGRRAERMPLALDSLDEAIRTFLEQFYSVSLIPDEVWITSDFADRAPTEAFLKQRSGKIVRIRVRRSEKPMRLLGMAYENAKLLYLEKNQEKKDSASEELRRVLDLPDVPHSVEGIDVSNLQGEVPAVAVVHFNDERPLKSRYRLYYPKTVIGQNDFAMIHEVVLRRFGKLQENPPPDLLLIDGGKGQLQAAIKALQELKVEVPILALAKSHTESAFALKHVQKSEERIFLPNRKNPLVLKEGNPALRLLQQVRDEAHRFSVKSHRVRRRKRTLEESPLTDISGVGEKTKALLLQHFGSPQRIAAASVEELVLAGVPRGRAEKLRAALNPEKQEEE
jgi:excinuclease ABC subunit C